MHRRRGPPSGPTLGHEMTTPTTRGDTMTTDKTYREQLTGAERLAEFYRRLREARAS
jgi:hypothetical protein